MTRVRARRLYRALLRLLPRDLRERFGPDMEQLFADRLAELDGRRAAAGWLWIAAAADVTWQSIRERTERAGRALGGFLREGTTMDGWRQDLRYGVRTLLRRPGFTLAAVGTLALGMGANVAIFTVVDGVLLSPLPYPDSDRLVTVYTDRGDGRRHPHHDHPDIRRWQDVVPGFGVAGYSGASRTLTGFGDPEVVSGTSVTDGLITLMGYRPFLGRDLVRADDVPDGPRVVVVSHRFWSGRLGRDPAVLGRALTLDGEPWEIVGVGPEGFDFPEGAEYWVPRRHQAEGCGHGCRMMRAMGRIDDGTTMEEVQSRLDAVSAALAREFPDNHRDDLARIEPMIDTEVADVRVALWVLFGAVGMVLLIACANVANLMIVRSAARAGEIALRATLGASGTRLVRQLLTESLLIATAAGFAGLGLAHWGTRALVALAPESLPRLDETGLDGGVLLFAGLLAVGVTALFGLLPAAQVSSGSLTDGLGGGARTAGRRGGGLSRSVLLAGEIALSLSLLLGTGLLLRTLAEIRTVDFGIATSGVERFRLGTPESRYDAEATVRFQEALEERLAALPGVGAAGIGFGIPLASGNIGTSVSLLDRPPVDAADEPSFRIRPSTPGFLEASGMRLVRGRWFTADDRRDGEAVAVVNEAAVRLHYPGVDPLGKQVHAHASWGFEEEPPRTIVGVVADVRARTATEEPEPALYMPNAQFAADAFYVTLRLAEGVRTVMPEARSIVRELDPDLAITLPSRIEDAVAEDQATTRFYLTLLSVFAGVALALAAVGLYGVVAYAVSQRTREIGIRIALGAGGERVTKLVLAQGMRPALAGLALGLGLSALGARALSTLLYGVEPHDPVAVLSAIGILAAVVLAATLLPAKRATRVPPATALRAE